MKDFVSYDGYSRRVDNFHKWSERKFEIKTTHVPLIDKDTKIVAIGSCFAKEVVKYLAQKGYNIQAHPNGLQYNTFTIRDHIKHLFSIASPYNSIVPLEREKDKWRHPYKKISTSPTCEEAKAYSDALDTKARDIWKNAEIIIITLGLTEIWEDQSGLVQIEIPHANIFNKEIFLFRKTSYKENLDNLEEAYCIIRNISDAKIIVTVSPVPLYITFSDEDVTVANAESKSILRAVAGEFSSKHPDIFYFPSFEIVMYSMDPSKYLKEDGRHVTEEGVRKIMEKFIRTYGRGGIVSSEDNLCEKIMLYGIDSSLLKKGRIKLKWL